MLKDRLELCGYFSLSSNYTLEMMRKSFRLKRVAASEGEAMIKGL
jgi:hypothetical protein